MRDTPYTADEQRVCAYILKITNNQIGCGEDPIAFLISSHEVFRLRLARYEEALRSIAAHGDRIVEGHGGGFVLTPKGHVECRIMAKAALDEA